LLGSHATIGFTAGCGFSSGTAAERKQDEEHLHDSLGARSSLGSGQDRAQPALLGATCRLYESALENGTVVLGGPFANATGSLVIVEAENEHEVADLFASDPFVVHAIFVLSSLKQWLLLLDARREG
jgi:YCII-related domain